MFHRKYLLRDLKNNEKTLDNLLRIDLKKYSPKKRRQLRLDIETARLNTENSLRATNNRVKSINDFSPSEENFIKRCKDKFSEFNKTLKPYKSGVVKESLMKNYRKGNLTGQYKRVYLGNMYNK